MLLLVKEFENHKIFFLYSVNSKLFSTFVNEPVSWIKWLFALSLLIINIKTVYDHPFLFIRIFEITIITFLSIILCHISLKCSTNYKIWLNIYIHIGIISNFNKYFLFLFIFFINLLGIIIYYLLFTSFILSN